MADDYQGDVGGILTTQGAEQLGTSQANSFGNQMDMGAQLQQNIVRTQMMKQQLQQQMQDNHDNMVNHIGQSLYKLSSADDDDKKGPVWKMQRDETLKKMQAIGVNPNPDVLDAFLKGNSGKFTSALAQVMDPRGSPHDSATALKTLANSFDSMDDAVKAPDELLKAHAAVLQSTNKAGNLFETQAKGLRDQVKGVSQKYDVSGQFVETAQGILADLKSGKLTTGQGEVAFKDAYNKALSGGAPRSFTLNMMDQNRSAGNKLDSIFSKIETGKKLQPDELGDMGVGLNVMSNDMNEKKLQETAPYYMAGKSLVARAQASGYMDLTPNQIMDEKLWNQHVDREAGVQYNTSTGKYEKPGSAAPVPVKQTSKQNTGLKPYAPGANQAQDNFIKSFASGGGHTLADVNKVIGKKGYKIDQQTLNTILGVH